jgi:hypothetical protein
MPSSLSLQNSVILVTEKESLLCINIHTPPLWKDCLQNSEPRLYSSNAAALSLGGVPLYIVHLAALDVMRPTARHFYIGVHKCFGGKF